MKFFPKFSKRVSKINAIVRCICIYKPQYRSADWLIIKKLHKLRNKQKITQTMKLINICGM